MRMGKKERNEIETMRYKLLTMYPSGVMRGQSIIDMSDSQIYAIYKKHRERNISTKKPRMKKNRQVPGQINMLAQMH